MANTLACSQIMWKARTTRLLAKLRFASDESRERSRSVPIIVIVALDECG